MTATEESVARPTAPPVLVQHHSRQWVIEPGQSVSFGRGSPCDIRIADDPLDEHVSRRAGVLEHLGDDLLLRNHSSSRSMIVNPARSGGRLVEPGEAITFAPGHEFLVALSGRDGNHYVIQVSPALP